MKIKLGLVISLLLGSLNAHTQLIKSFDLMVYDLDSCDSCCNGIAGVSNINGDRLLVYNQNIKIYWSNGVEHYANNRLCSDSVYSIFVVYQNRDTLVKEFHFPKTYGIPLRGDYPVITEPLKHAPLSDFSTPGSKLNVYDELLVDGETYFKVFDLSGTMRWNYPLQYIAAKAVPDSIHNFISSELSKTSYDLVYIDRSPFSELPGYSYPHGYSVVLVQNRDTLRPINLDLDHYMVKQGPFEICVLNDTKVIFSKSVIAGNDGPIIITPQFEKKRKRMVFKDVAAVTESVHYNNLLTHRRDSDHCILFDFKPLIDGPDNQIGEHGEGKAYTEFSILTSWTGNCVDGFANGAGIIYTDYGLAVKVLYSGTLLDGVPNGSGIYFYGFNGNIVAGISEHGKKLVKQKVFIRDLQYDSTATKQSDLFILETHYKDYKGEPIFDFYADDSIWYYDHLIRDTLTPNMNTIQHGQFSSCAEHIFLSHTRAYSARTIFWHSSSLEEFYVVQCKNKKLFEIEWQNKEQFFQEISDKCECE